MTFIAITMDHAMVKMNYRKNAEDEISRDKRKKI